MRKLALLLPLLALVSCAGLRDLASAAIQRPTLEFREATVQSVDLEGATIGVSFDLANPNGFGVDLARVSWGVDVEETHLADGVLPGGLKVPAYGKAPLTIPVHVRFRDVPGILTLLTSRRDEIHYKVSGSAGVRTPVGVLDLPLTHSDTLKLPALPGFSIQGVSVRGASFSDVAFDVKVRVQNPNPFPMPAGKLDYALSIAGAEVARAHDAALAKLGAGGATTVTIPVKVDLARLGGAASALVRGGDVQVGLAGTADFAGLPLPLDLKGRVPAGR
jgi:LEA14-like dessication related protein